MKQTTLELIRNVLSTDETILQDDAKAISKQLETSTKVRKPRPGTIKQAAEILNVHPVTVRRYAQAGLLTQIRITCRKVRYDLNEVEELANSGVSNKTEISAKE